MAFSIRCWRIWADDVEVAGSQHRIENAIAFAQGEDHSLTLEPDPTNEHDPNAVKVFGWAKSNGLFQRSFLGYVPKKVAGQMPAEFQPRIKNIWMGGYHK